MRCSLQRSDCCWKEELLLVMDTSSDSGFTSENLPSREYNRCNIHASTAATQMKIINADEGVIWHANKIVRPTTWTNDIQWQWTGRYQISIPLEIPEIITPWLLRSVRTSCRSGRPASGNCKTRYWMHHVIELYKPANTLSNKRIACSSMQLASSYKP